MPVQANFIKRVYSVRMARDSKGSNNKKGTKGALRGILSLFSMLETHYARREAKPRTNGRLFSFVIPPASRSQMNETSETREA